MSSRRTAVFTLATFVFACGQAFAQSQVGFGKPVAVEKSPNETAPDEFGLAPPTRTQLFRVQSEQSLKERLRQELPKVKKVDFPKDASKLPEVAEADAASFPEQVASPVTSQICYRPLYFEDKRTERHGQYVPCVQPLISAGRFYADVVVFPVHVLLTPPWTFQCDNR